MNRFEYRVCAVQEGRVTWVNGAWAGSVPPTADPATALATCPEVPAYLAQVGLEGWELVSVTALVTADTVLEKLYLKRVRYSETQLG